jgi:hypothetical protein
MFLSPDMPQLGHTAIRQSFGDVGIAFVIPRGAVRAAEMAGRKVHRQYAVVPPLGGVRVITEVRDDLVIAIQNGSSVP